MYSKVCYVLTNTKKQKHSDSIKYVYVIKSIKSFRVSLESKIKIKKREKNS